MKPNNQDYASLTLRVGLGFVLCWFGLRSFLQPEKMVGWVPEGLGFLPLTSKLIVLLTGVIETTIGTVILLGILTQIAAIFAAILIFVIILFAVGYNEIGVRDFGLLTAAVALACLKSDKFNLRELFKKGFKNKRSQGN